MTTSHSIPIAGCCIHGCERPHKRYGYCYGHYMKWWRYGDPEWTAPKRRKDLLGEKFGHLTVVGELDPQHWECLCECGRTTRVRAWSLTSGGTRTCGHGPTHHRSDDAGYPAVHHRVRRDKGTAASHACVDCGKEAAHWSYDHRDPDERRDEENGLAYSLYSIHYEPRCVPCHKSFDMSHGDEWSDS